jgi:hypothetical protein
MEEKIKDIWCYELGKKYKPEIIQYLKQKFKWSIGLNKKFIRKVLDETNLDERLHIDEMLQKVTKRFLCDFISEHVLKTELLKKSIPYYHKTPLSYRINPKYVYYSTDIDNICANIHEYDKKKLVNIMKTMFNEPNFKEEFKKFAIDYKKNEPFLRNIQNTGKYSRQYLLERGIQSKESKIYGNLKSENTMELLDNIPKRALCYFLKDYPHGTVKLSSKSGALGKYHRQKEELINKQGVMYKHPLPTAPSKQNMSTELYVLDFDKMEKMDKNELIETYKYIIPDIEKLFRRGISRRDIIIEIGKRISDPTTVRYTNDGLRGIAIENMKIYVDAKLKYIDHNKHLLDYVKLGDTLLPGWKLPLPWLCYKNIFRSELIYEMELFHVILDFYNNHKPIRRHFTYEDDIRLVFGNLPTYYSNPYKNKPLVNDILCSIVYEYKLKQITILERAPRFIPDIKRHEDYILFWHIFGDGNLGTVSCKEGLYPYRTDKYLRMSLNRHKMKSLGNISSTEICKWNVYVNIPFTFMSDFLDLPYINLIKVPPNFLSRKDVENFLDEDIHTAWPLCAYISKYSDKDLKKWKHLLEKDTGEPLRHQFIEHGYNFFKRKLKKIIVVNSFEDKSLELPLVLPKIPFLKRTDFISFADYMSEKLEKFSFIK